MSLHDVTFTAIDGSPLPLKSFAGKAVLVVNTASECGFTPQYAELERLWKARKDEGLVVLGVPSNDFGAQEPGTEAQIKSFCESRYGVTFPLTAKTQVIGKGAHAFYQRVAEELGEDAAPRWNFHKYLIDAKGELAGAWPSKVKPESKEIAEAIRGALGG